MVRGGRDSGISPFVCLMRLKRDLWMVLLKIMMMTVMAVTPHLRRGVGGHGVGIGKGSHGHPTV